MHTTVTLDQMQVMQIIGALNNTIRDLQNLIASTTGNDETSTESKWNYQTEIKALSQLIQMFITAEFK